LKIILIGKMGASIALEHAQTFDHGELPEKSGGPGKLVNLMRGLPAFPRVFVNIVDKQISRRDDVSDPSFIICVDDLISMSPINKNET
jgi:hypothetical protein